MARRIAGVAVAVLALVALSGCMSKDQTADFNLINKERKANHLALVKGNDPAQTKAQKWAQHLAATGVLEHTGGGSAVDPKPLTGWCAYGENVGKGHTISAIHTDFMNSPSHKANILGNYNRVGIGVATGKGYLWVVEVYFKAC